MRGASSPGGVSATRGVHSLVLAMMRGEVFPGLQGSVYVFDPKADGEGPLNMVGPVATRSVELKSAGVKVATTVVPSGEAGVVGERGGRAARMYLGEEVHANLTDNIWRCICSFATHRRCPQRVGAESHLFS